MNTETLSIVEGNKLIAEFMEFSHSHEYYDWDGKHEVKYHSSWSRLMPVVEKIESLDKPFNVTITKYDCVISTVEFFGGGDVAWVAAESKTKIEAVWQAVVQFIQFYNNQTKQS